MTNFIFKAINESKSSNYEGNRDEFYNLNEVDIINKKNGNIIKVDPKNIINVVDNALFYMEKNFKYFFLFVNSYKIMYTSMYPSKICDTMCVDEKNNLWINMNFVYNDCQMNQNNVFGILFHEMFHILLEHIIRYNKLFPQNKLSSVGKEMLSILNRKANIAMDYEINASMVEDGIVDENFWKKMNGLFKKEYTGLSWEDIYHKYGDKEYKEWLEKNGVKISDEELEILEAIEKAAKVLRDPKSSDEDKAKANRELQKVLDKIFGRNRENDIQDIFEKMKDTQLGSFGDIKNKMEEVIDDLYKDPSKMSDEQYDKLLNDIDEMAIEMAKNRSQIADRFKKTEEDTFDDIKKMRKALHDSMDKLRNEKMSKAERKQVMDKISDCLEDVISNDVNKQKNDKKRKERDENREKEIKEELKQKHPVRKFINVLKNLMNLCGGDYNLVCKKSYDIMNDIVKILDPITEKNISEVTNNDVDDLKPLFPKLKDSIFTDLKALIDNKTILTLTEDDILKILDNIFKSVENTFFKHLLNANMNDDKKIGSLFGAAQDMRKIGKLLKTQKKYKASDEFKEGYREARDELLAIFKKDKKECLKKLYELGILNVSNTNTLDKRSKDLFDELVADGEIKI